MSRQLIVSMLIGSFLLAFVAGTLTHSASAAPAGPLSRTPVWATATAQAATAAARPASPAAGSIVLRVADAPPSAWTVVQWQDGLGGWHDVEGWRGDLDEGGQKVWWVLAANFGQGPFRWVIYERRDGKVWGTSESFYLPDGGGKQVEVALGQ